MSPPSDPIAAVVHPNPYPYYAELVAQRPLYRDEKLGMWVATSAAAVEPVLTDPGCRVRPAAEPVPPAIRGGAAGDFFGSLVRQNDGPLHALLKSTLSRSLTALDPTLIARWAAEWSRLLADRMDPQRNPSAINAFALHLPVCVVASLLGFDQEAALRFPGMIDQLVGSFVPGASAERIGQGHRAATALMEEIREGSTRSSEASPPCMLAALTQVSVPGQGLPVDLRIANAVGLITQSYEATAGLIGNTLVALAADSSLLERARRQPSTLANTVLEVARHDAPVQNTRRFLAQDAEILGQRMRTGDTVLVVLAAANRDPAANSNPDCFNPNRNYRRIFTFGLGPHACPGKNLAVAIAQAGVADLLAAGIDVETVTMDRTYRPSTNVRVPVFGPAGSAATAVAAGAVS